jgi:hypothetical protein
MQSGKKDIENLLVNMVLKIKTLKRHKSKRQLSMPLHFFT